MHKVTVIETRNSLYVVTSLQGAETVEVMCAVGTFQGQTFTVTRQQWAASAVQEGRGFTVPGVLTTSTIQGVTEFYAPAPRVTQRPAQGFVDAVVGHIRDQVNPVAILDPGHL